LIRKEKDDEFISSVPVLSAGKTVLIAAIGILYLSGLLEIYYQFSTRYTEAPVHSIFIQAYSFAFVFILLQFFKKNTAFPLLKFLLTAFCFVLYLINIPVNLHVSISLLTGNGNSGLFIAHWIADLLLLWILYDLIRFFFKKDNKNWFDYRSAFTWISAIGIILLLSIELNQINMWVNYKNENDWIWWSNLYQKAGLSILWSICSFAMMWLGMKHSFRTLRIISLSLFTVTLIKLFAFDIRNIPPGGKITAFILLGVLLLVVSFMYQRLKKIIIEDANN
jgi:hypothetical protein